MKFVKCDLPAEYKTLEIEIFSDLHLGSKKCDVNLIKRRIERVRTKENARAILVGDIMNTALKNSKSDVYEDTLSPNDQLKFAVSLFEPIKDKIIGITDGNHENRVLKETSISPMAQLAVQLGLVDYFDSISCLLFIRFGSQINHGNPRARRTVENSRKNTHTGRKICYTLYMTHGSGGGGTVGSSANRLSKRGEVVDADIIVSGHTHKEMYFSQASYKVDPQNNSAYLKEQIFVNGGSTLDYEGYAEQIGCKPTTKRTPTIILNGTSKGVDIISRNNW